MSFLHFRDDDRLIALNGQPISHFDHVTIVEMLKEVLNFSEEDRCLTLVSKFKIFPSFSVSFICIFTNRYNKGLQS